MLVLNNVKHERQIDSEEEIVRELDLHDEVRKIVLEVMGEVAPKTLTTNPKQHKEDQLPPLASGELVVDKHKWQ